MDLGEQLFGTNPIARYKDQPITDLIAAILPNVYVVAGIILFLYLVFGGFLMVSAGGNPKNMDQGKATITQAAVGLLIIFTSYWLIQIIEIITGINIFNSTL